MGAGRHPLAPLRETTAVAGEPFVRCSQLPDPAGATTTALTTATSASDLHDDIMAACTSKPLGCIVTLAPGTYDGNVVFGDSALKSGSITPTGEVIIRGLDRNNPPVIRGTVDFKGAVIHAKNITTRIRVEDVILDGRRSEQTIASMTAVCTDSPADGICDGACTDNQSSTLQSGFSTRNTSTGQTQSCLLRVQVRETVDTGIQLQNATKSTVESSTVSGVGCTATSCPALSIPTDACMTSIMKTAQGVQINGGTTPLINGSVDSAVVDSTISNATKIGIECFNGSRRCHIRGNTVSNTGFEGIVLNESDGDMMENVVSSIGLLNAHNTLMENSGRGVVWAGSSSYQGMSVTISKNRISNTWGSGLQAGLIDHVDNSASVTLDGNSVAGSCNGTTRTDAAGIDLGDSANDIYQVRTRGNTTTTSACPDGTRLRNLRDFRGLGNSTTSGIEIDAVDSLFLDGNVIRGNLDIDSSTVGVVRNCALSGSVVGAANIVRSNCGA